MAKKGRKSKKMKKGGCVIHAPVKCKQITKHHNPEATYHKKKGGLTKAQKKATCVLKAAGRLHISLKEAWRRAKNNQICRTIKKKAKGVQTRLTPRVRYTGSTGAYRYY